jgi:hypothetical protein
MQKAHAPECVGFLVILVGRAGLEPATNGLKAPVAVTVALPLFRYAIRLPEVCPCSSTLMDE